MSSPRRVIVDTDVAMGVPGSDIDDGFALALVHGAPELQLELVTTVNGNTDVWTSTRLARELLDSLGARDVPVVRGAAQPLVRPAEMRRPKGGAPAGDGGVRRYAAEQIARLVLDSPGEVTILAIGPLTNVAAAIALDERVAPAIGELVVMGGVFTGQTNHSGLSGEWNIWVDPEAAEAVLQSGVRPRFVGLDVTMRVTLDAHQIDRIASSGRPFARYAAQCARAWLEHLAARYPGSPQDASFHLHDPLAVAALTRPSLLRFAPAAVRVAVVEPARGTTVADLLGHDGAGAPNCDVALDVDAEAFVEYVIETIGGLQ